MKNSAKRSYHPLVQFFYFSGMLSDKQIAHIPKSTIDYWKSIEHESMYGYEWVEKFYIHHHNFDLITKREIVFKSIRFCVRVLDGFTSTFAHAKHYKKVLRNNTQSLIKTIDHLIFSIPLNKACKAFRITTNQYYRWKNKLFCSASVLNICFKAHPSQLSLQEVKIMEETINAPENIFKPLSTLHFHLMREGLVFIGRSTFYKYAKLLCPDRPKPKKEKNQFHFRASRVFEFLHIDTTPILTDKGIIKVAFVKDNKSKAILHKAILPDGGSLHIKKLLVNTFEKHKLYKHPHPIHIMSDGGSENKGDLLQWIGENDHIKKITAKKDVPFSNNMSESIHHIFKSEFMRYKPISDERALQNYLDLFEEYYNHHRFPIELHGCSPMEVVNGLIPDKYKFKKDLHIARHRRYLENKAEKFCAVCC